MELYMMNIPHGRMVLESVEKGLLIWPTIEENGVTRPRKYSELTPADAIQADSEDVNPRQQATINDGIVTLQPVQGRQISFATGTSRTYTPGASGSNSGKQRTVISQANGQILHEEELAFLADPGRVLQGPTLQERVEAMPSSEQSNVVNHSETEITSDSNIIPYSQYMIESQQAAIQNSNSSAQQDALILSVIEQLKTQVVNCTKINLDNKSVNDTLTAELKRYKEHVKVLKEGQNVDLKSNDIVLDSSAQSIEIDFLKRTLSEHLKEKESLMQIVTLLKNNFKKEESRNYDREIALEKRIKQLDNRYVDKTSVFLRIPTTKTTSSAIMILDSEETLMLAEKSRSKMLLKQQDQMMLEINPSPSCIPTKIEVPKELPKVSMVNTSLKKLKHHLVGFDVVVKARTTATSITKGSENSVSNQSAPSFDQYFELNELKAQLQEKDTFIKMLKERIKSLSGNMNDNKIKKDIEEIETINIELDHRVSKLIAENEHLKQTYKQLYDSIKPTRIRSKEQCDALINQVNQKSVEISDLNVSLQEKDLVITALKDELRKLKGKDLADNVVTKHTIAPEMLKIDVEPIAPRLLNNRTAHSDYLRHTQEQAAILREIVEQGKSQNPLNNSLDSACKYTKRIQELLIIIRQTCPSINNSSDKLVAVTPKNKDKRVRFTEPVTSSGNTNTKIASSSNLVSNKPMLSSTGVKSSTSASGSQPSGNTKKDKIQRTPRNANVQHSKLNANSKLLCVKCNGCMLSNNHDLCVLDFINDETSVEPHYSRKMPFPLTRITTTAEVPLRKPTALESDTPKPVVTLVYSRKPKKSKTNVPVSKPKIIKSISANKKEPSKSWGSIVSDVPSSSLDECRNDHVAKILGYGDYQIGNVTISRVYYVEGLGHNLFSVGQFCDLNLEVAFRQHTCFIRNLEGVDLLTGSRGNNLYTLSLRDMMASSPICLLSTASKTKSCVKIQDLDSTRV
ncbi:hypothetical protein Tco_1547522 [Tanacetum coccineum]